MKLIKEIKSGQVTKAGILHTLRKIEAEPVSNDQRIAVEFTKLLLNNFENITKVKSRLTDKY